MKQRMRRFNPTYEIFTMALAVYSLLGVLLIWILPDDSSTAQVFFIIDFATSFFFLFDFLRSFVIAERRWSYLISWGWMDLLASLPAGPLFLRLFRIPRIFRAIERIRYRSRRELFREFVRKRADTTLFTAVMTVIIVLTWSSILILDIEQGAANAQITSAEDAVWWSFVSITTVGYGDLVPVTGFGRLVAVSAMIVGVGLYGVLTSYLSSKLLSRKEEDLELKQALGQLDELQARFDRLERHLGIVPDRPDEGEQDPEKNANA